MLGVLELGELLGDDDDEVVRDLAVLLGRLVELQHQHRPGDGVLELGRLYIRRSCG